MGIYNVESTLIAIRGFPIFFLPFPSYRWVHFQRALARRRGQVDLIDLPIPSSTDGEYDTCMCVCVCARALQNACKMSGRLHRADIVACYVFQCTVHGAIFFFSLR
jgi:hypothetical protein